MALTFISCSLLGLPPPAGAQIVPTVIDRYLSCAEPFLDDWSRSMDALAARYRHFSGVELPHQRLGDSRMKKFKHEAELFKAALLAGVEYAEGRKAVEFEATDSAANKALYVYRLLVHDKVISPMPEEQVGEKTIRHRLAAWYAHQLPEGHPLRE